MRVFIADDEPLVLLGFQKMVLACGHEVAGVATTGPEALEAIIRIVPDIIMIDINLPGMDGISVIESSIFHPLLLLDTVTISPLSALQLPGSLVTFKSQSINMKLNLLFPSLPPVIVSNALRSRSVTMR